MQPWVTIVPLSLLSFSAISRNPSSFTMRHLVYQVPISWLSSRICFGILSCRLEIAQGSPCWACSGLFWIYSAPVRQKRYLFYFGSLNHGLLYWLWLEAKFIFYWTSQPQVSPSNPKSPHTADHSLSRANPSSFSFS